jgi:hypothetical protein
VISIVSAGAKDIVMSLPLAELASAPGEPAVPAPPPREPAAPAAAKAAEQGHVLAGTPEASPSGRRRSGSSTSR